MFTPASLKASITDKPYSVAPLPVPVVNAPIIRPSNPLVKKAAGPPTAIVGK